MNKKSLGIIALLSILGSAIFAPAAFGQTAPTVPQLQSQLQNLLQQLQQLQGQLPPGGAQAIGSIVIPNLTRNFGLGSSDATTNGEVSVWQALIVAQNKGQAAQALKAAFDSGVGYGFFGGLTGRATQEWQSSQGITPTCQCVGPRTRAAVANLGRSQEQLRVVTPNGGEILNIGQTYTIRWTGPAVILANQSLRIYLENASGQSLGLITRITSTSEIQNKQYNWQVNPVIGGDLAIAPGQYKVKILLYNDVATPVSIVAQDESDATFQIVATSGPTITSISPTSGPVGTQVTITGSGFTPTGNNIKFNSSILILSNPPNVSSNGTALTFVIPNAAVPPCPPNVFCDGVNPIISGDYSVSVTNINGTSNSVNFTVTGGTSAIAPTITSISPSSGSVGTQVTITGSGFTGVPQTPLAYANNSVNLRDAAGTASGAISVYSTDGTHLSFAIPTSITQSQSGWPVSAGPYKISVSNPNGTSNTVDFMITTQGVAPAITSISPTVAAKGSTVTITGSGFTPTGNIIYYDYTPTVHPALTGNLSSANGAALSFVVPQSVGGGALPVIYSVEGAHKIWVVNANGVSNSVNFTVTAASAY